VILYKKGPFRVFFLKLGLYSVRADAEPVDPKNYLEERCKPQCVKSLYDYEVCVHLS